MLPDVNAQRGRPPKGEAARDHRNKLVTYANAEQKAVLQRAAELAAAEGQPVKWSTWSLEKLLKAAKAEFKKAGEDWPL